MSPGSNVSLSQSKEVGEDDVGAGVSEHILLLIYCLSLLTLDAQAKDNVGCSQVRENGK